MVKPTPQQPNRPEASEAQRGAAFEAIEEALESALNVGEEIADQPLKKAEEILNPGGASGPANRDRSAVEQAQEFLEEMTVLFRERLKFGSGGTRSPSGVAVERIKLLANYFNTVAAGLLTAGLIGPMAGYLFGFAAPGRPLGEILEGVVVIFLLSVCLHVLGRLVLGRLTP